MSASLDPQFYKGMIVLFPGFWNIGLQFFILHNFVVTAGPMGIWLNSMDCLQILLQLYHRNNRYLFPTEKTQKHQLCITAPYIFTVFLILLVRLHTILMCTQNGYKFCSRSFWVFSGGGGWQLPLPTVSVVQSTATSLSQSSPY